MICNKLIKKLKQQGFTKKKLMKLAGITDYRTFENRANNDDPQLACLLFVIDLKLTGVKIGATIELSDIDLNLK
ncbi:MAG: hypothetical protein ACJAZX_000608 [Rickettsiales bacterium]|jgi:hypothetical protein